ncbi:HEAT repeat domain-containing protein [Altericista sp. CCNU0014]|uniref:HEAT repeat domain-containing protein n=1 Tax=Altericista sp. CCNU0014 TaxID=3082949 RepID=UPI00384BBBD4
MIEPGDFQPYIQSILDSSHKDGDWGDRYILTQAELPLRVQTYESSSNDLEQSQSTEKKQREQFAVLDGLRKYAPEQALLVGKPGSGKSTALRRLRWEEANRCAQAIEQNQEAIPPIPVLLELRSLGGSVLELLRETLEWSGVDLEERALKALLREKQFLLLLDGVNELPHDAAQKAVSKFRQLCASARVPLIFTTRELGAGFDLGISRKLEMLPLSEPQVREFVQKQLPEHGDVLLRQLQGRLRELAETPLLLKLLCEVFRHNKHQVPRSRGELFRLFARDYDQIKPWDTVAASPGFREFRDELLRELAAEMMQGVQPTGLRLQISRDEAERILEKGLAGRVEAAGQKAKEWLEDLIKYHLLQVAADPNQIEFHHQLFQEYYAGEWLFLQLKSLSDDELKYQYLNYLKWTEPLAMTFSFVEFEQQAEHLVQLALAIDWSLGARLSGEVKTEYQEKTTQLIQKLKTTTLVKIALLEKAQSEKVLDSFRELLTHTEVNIRRRVTWALKSMPESKVIPLIETALKDLDSRVCDDAVHVMKQLKSLQPVSLLDNVLTENFSENSCIQAVFTLQNIASKEAILTLLKTTLHSRHNVRVMAIEALKKLCREEVISTLDMALASEDPFVKVSSVKMFINLEDETVAPYLYKALLDLNEKVSMEARKGLNLIQEKAILNVQKKIESARIDPELKRRKTIERHIKDVEFGNSIQQRNAMISLYCLGEDILPIVIKHLDSPDIDKQFNACNMLSTHLVRRFPEKINIFKKLIPKLLKILENREDSLPHADAASVLGQIGDQTVCPNLLQIMKYKESDTRMEAANALVKLGCQDVTQDLFAAIQDPGFSVQNSAVRGLGVLQCKEAIPKLIDLFEDSLIETSVYEALSQFHGNTAAEYLPKLVELISTQAGEKILQAIAIIQSNCKFYDYNIAKSSPPEKNIKKLKRGVTYININSPKTQIFEQVDNYIENNINHKDRKSKP